MNEGFKEIKIIHWNYHNLDDFPEEKLKILHECRLDLYLKGNNIKKLPQNPLYFNYLREIHLNENCIEYIPKGMCKLPYLRYLNISDNLLTTVPEEIKHLTELRSLLVDNNYIEYLPLSLQLMPNIKMFTANDDFSWEFVTGNNLYWLPQKIGQNFYSTTFTFWKNKNLHSIPYRVWLHVIQNIRIPSSEHLSYIDDYKEQRYYKRSKILMLREKKWKFNIPREFIDIKQYPDISPPSLCELCLRSLQVNLIKDNFLAKDNATRNIIDYLPKHLYNILKNGPTGTCDLLSCRSPLFEYAILMATLKKIENREHLVIAYFCSKLCSEKGREALNIQQLEWTTIS